MRKSKKKKKAPVEPSEIAPVFTVEPETITLKPNTGCEFSFYGNTSLTDTFLEELICEIKQGKEKNGRPMLACKCHGIFIDPVLEPSVKELSYVYTCERTAAYDNVNRERKFRLALGRVMALRFIGTDMHGYEFSCQL